MEHCEIETRHLQGILPFTLLINCSILLTEVTLIYVKLAPLYKVSGIKVSLITDTACISPLDVYLKSINCAFRVAPP